jgi:hypothetical protein
MKFLKFLYYFFLLSAAGAAANNTSDLVKQAAEFHSQEMQKLQEISDLQQRLEWRMNGNR